MAKSCAERRGVQQTAARRRRLVSSSAYRRASSRLVAGHNNRVSNSASFKKQTCCLLPIRPNTSLLLSRSSPSPSSRSSRRDKRTCLTIKTNRFVPSPSPTYRTLTISIIEENREVSVFFPVFLVSPFFRFRDWKNESFVQRVEKNVVFSIFKAACWLKMEEKLITYLNIEFIISGIDGTWVE